MPPQAIDRGAGIARAREAHARFLASRPDLVPANSSPPPIPAFDRHAIYARFGTKPRIRIEGACVLMAADSAQFVPLQLSLASLLLSHDVPVTVLNLGMTRRERAWLVRQGVEVAEPPAGPMPRSEAMWQTWNKPTYFDRALLSRVLWLDNDTVVGGDLTPMFEAIGVGPLLVRDHFARDESIMANRPGLYERFPTPGRLTNVCGGVVGLDLDRDIDRSLLSRWRFILARAAEDPEVRREIAWWDQGCLLWAMEGLRLEAGGPEAWNRAGRPQVALSDRFDSPDAMFAAMDAAGEAVIWHYQGTPKPYGWGPHWRISLRPAPNLSVSILGHEPFSRPKREWLEEIDMSESDPDQSWGECRYFDRCEIPDAEYVGLASFSWTQKYDILGTLAPWEFGELDLAPDVVHCALRTDCRTFFDSSDWLEHMENASPGITPLIRELQSWSGLAEVAASAWSNNWVVHRDVFADVVAFYRRASAYFKSKYPTCPYKAAVPAKEWGYLGEAITVHYLASRGDLTFKEMRWPDSSSERTTNGPPERHGSPMTGLPYSGDLGDLPLATMQRLTYAVNRCEFRGCRVSCTKAGCSRYGLDATMKQCVECVRDGGCGPASLDALRDWDARKRDRTATLDARLQPLRETSATGA